VVVEPSTPDLIEFLLQALGRNRRVAATRTGAFILAKGLHDPALSRLAPLRVRATRGNVGASLRLAQLRDFFRSDCRWLRAEAGGDVIGDSGDLGIRIALAEGRHEGMAGLPLPAREDDLRHVGRCRVVDGARAGEGGDRLDRNVPVNLVNACRN
jgi:hypothetical protein